MKAITMLSVLFALNAAAQTRPDTHTVQILSAKETIWTTSSNNLNCTITEPLPGSLPGAGPSTNCSGGDHVMPHMQVDIVVRMPDGSEVKMECHHPGPTIWNSALCFKPPVGPSQAKIDKHGIRLPSTWQGKPEYNKDGTLKKPGKVEVVWVKFSFE